MTLENYAYFEEPPEGWLFIEQSRTNFDSEKGFADFRIILQRKEDQKYFELHYTDFGRGQNNLNEAILKEVYPHQKYTVVYKDKPSSRPDNMLIEKERYAQLLEAEKLAIALEQAGVDNWSGYSEAMQIKDEL